MRQIKNTLLITLIAFFFSCEENYLDPAPTSVLSSANYFTTPAQVETAVFNIYDGIQGVNSTSTNDNHAIQFEFYLTEMRSDNTRTKSSEGESAQFGRPKTPPTRQHNKKSGDPDRPKRFHETKSPQG